MRSDHTAAPFEEVPQQVAALLDVVAAAAFEDPGVDARGVAVGDLDVGVFGAADREAPDQIEALVGLDDEHVWLEVGDAGRVAAVFDNAQVSATRISSVQYIHWPLDDNQRRVLRGDGTVVRIVIDHPHYQAQAVLGEETRKEIARDLE